MDKYNTIFVYINEAHAHNIWPIGLSAGTINYSHKNLDDRLGYIQKLKNEYELNIPMYMDNMDNDIQNKLSSWPFRYFLIKYNENDNNFIFDKIGEPEDSEMDILHLME